LPKIRAWAAVAGAQIARNALTQALAVLAPDKLAAQMESASRGGGASAVSETPLSAEDFQRLIGNTA
jgi:hypothetical protein